MWKNKLDVEVETNVLFLNGEKKFFMQYVWYYHRKYPMSKNTSAQVTWLVDNLESSGVNVTSILYIQQPKETAYTYSIIRTFLCHIKQRLSTTIRWRVTQIIKSKGNNRMKILSGMMVN